MKSDIEYMKQSIEGICAMFFGPSGPIAIVAQTVKALEEISGLISNDQFDETAIIRVIISEATERMSDMTSDIQNKWCDIAIKAEKIAMLIPDMNEEELIIEIKDFEHELNNVKFETIMGYNNGTI